MQSVSPVLTEHEVGAEQVIALGDPEYLPIIVARIRYAGGEAATLTRFRLSDDERKAIAGGADLLLSQPHHGPLMPIGIQFAMAESYPES
jgi:hypothetical protein